MKFLLESPINTGGEEFIDLIKLSNHDYKIVDFEPYYDFHSILKKFGWVSKFDQLEEYPIVVKGSIQFVREYVSQFGNFGFGTWTYDFKEFNCNNYYKWFSNDILFNHDNLIITLESFQKNLIRLFDWMGENDKIFVRPVSGFKSFDGTVLSRKSHIHEIKKLFMYDPDPNELVLVSPYKSVKNEYRMVIVDGEIITGSTYRIDGEIQLDTINNVSNKFNTFLQNVMSNCKFEVYTIDVVETPNGEFKLMEISCFNIADLYKSDMNKIVNALYKFYRKTH